MISRLDVAEDAINLNNAGTVTNASKDRLRVKKRGDEIEAMSHDFITNCRNDPEEVDKTVKHEIEMALLRMTEKKVLVDLKLDEADQKVQEKDAKIKELETLVTLLKEQVDLLQADNDKMNPN